jgi:hypothetical protein
LKTQIIKCKEYRERHDYHIYKILTDVESGASDKRPGFLKLREKVENKTFDVVQKLLQSSGKVFNRRKTKSTTLFSGLMRCECGSKMYALKYSKPTKNYYYYKCDNKACGKKVRQEIIEKKKTT